MIDNKKNFVSSNESANTNEELNSRLAKIEHGFDSVLRKAKPEIFDVIYDCKETLMNEVRKYPEAKDDDDLAMNYAVISFYMSRSDFDKKKIYEKLNSSKIPCKYCNLNYAHDKETNTLDAQDSLNELMYNNALEKLPPRDLEYYDSLNETLHVMHQALSNLRNTAMLYYALLCAAMNYDGEKPDVIYMFRGVVPTPPILGLRGGDGVPNEVKDAVRRLADSYGDICIDDINITWYNSHLNMGSNYRYDISENVSIEASCLDSEQVKRFIHEATGVCEGVLEKLAAEKQRKKECKIIAIDSLRRNRNPNK